MDNKLKHVAVPSSEITSESTYFSRRDFLKAMGIVSAGALLAACAPKSQPGGNGAATGDSTPVPASDQTDELGDPVNSFDEITNYNNFYEFTTDKEGVARLSPKFNPKPWTVEVGGLVHKPQTFGIEDLLALFDQKERVYRLRCVEAWSMVIPWMGFELGELLKAVEPMASAKFVRFETVYRPDEMPGQRSPFYPWPYQEGLRLDEAYHPLALLATGLYGGMLPNQNGAPLRLVVPWKYGFKSIKSIVKIELVEEMPATLWNSIASNEYGFYSNVNPEVDHPRWSQASERRIGEIKRRETLMFNGYEEEVASLYAGMDLKVNY
ncbi:MAG: protein-methionine-sulfoxide reductase catalytic subunit MsrP [Chloroflexota bacterium]